MDYSRSDCSLTRCYASCAGPTQDLAEYRDTDPTIADCYYNKDLCSSSSDKIGLTEAQMTDKANFANFDFDSASPVWSIDLTGAINNGFPYLTNNHPEPRPEA